jgi:hypothetical protein
MEQISLACRAHLTLESEESRARGMRGLAAAAVRRAGVRWAEVADYGRAVSAALRGEKSTVGVEVDGERRRGGGSGRSGE